MGALGAALGLMRGAHRSFSTLAASGHHWYEARVKFAACDHAASMGLRTFDVQGVRSQKPDMAVSRIWAECPDKLRVEHSGTLPGRLDGEHLMVVDGDRWWSYDPRFGGRYGEARVQQSAPGLRTHFEDLLDPRRLLASQGLLTMRGFSFVGTTNVAGRQGFRLRASRGGRYLSLFNSEVVVDAECGILLRLIDWFHDEVVEARELTSLVLDQPHPPGLFEFAPPDGEEPLPMPASQRVTLDEAIRVAPFLVYLPSELPEGWVQDAILYSPGFQHQGHGGPELTIFYHQQTDSLPEASRSPAPSAVVTLRMRASEDVHCTPTVNWRIVRRKGQDLHVAEQHNDVRVKRNLGSTYIQLALVANTVAEPDAEVVFDIATSLVRAQRPSQETLVEVPPQSTAIHSASTKRKRTTPPRQGAVTPISQSPVTPEASDVLTVLYGARESVPVIWQTQATGGTQEGVRRVDVVPLKNDGPGGSDQTIQAQQDLLQAERGNWVTLARAEALDPGPVLALFELSVAGYVMVAGNRCVRLLARRGPTPLEFFNVHAEALSSALRHSDVDEVELVLDLTSLVLRRATARSLGKAVLSLQVQASSHFA